MAGAGAPLLEIGRITKPHGLRGEVLVTLTSTEASRLRPGSELWAGDRRVVVASSQPHQHRFIVTFDGVDSRTQAEGLQGLVLRAEPKAEADDEQGDTLWVHELIGARVVDLEGRVRGRVATVVANPASDLLELDSGELVPLRFVVGGVEHDEQGSVVRVDPPPGLLRG
jgi:16S rRNA processing protein RimM